MRFASAFVLALAVTSLANAAQILTATFTDLGGGKQAAVIAVGDGSNTGSWAINLTVTGAAGSTIEQVAAFGGAVNVHKETDANTYQSIVGSGYTKDLDTWYYDSIFTGTLTQGVTASANLFKVHVGTGAGVNWGTVNVMHVVFTGSALDYTASIGRASQAYNVAGTFQVPEPSSLAALALAAAAVIRGRRR